MTTSLIDNPGDAQARRLEKVYEQVAELLARPEVTRRLRTAGGEDEWSAMQILGHMVEMIPYWLSHCQAILAAPPESYHFGRSLDAPERLAGVEQGVTGTPDQLLALLKAEVQTIASALRNISPAEWDRKGVHASRGTMSIAEIVESFIVAHAESHLQQMQAALL